MSVAIAIRPSWFKGITNAKGQRSLNTELFLLSRSATIDVEPAEDSFSLYVGNASKTVDYLSHEADRFATVAFESLLTHAHIERHSRSIGWILIRAYYAAFFSVHALMRIHGWGCTRITPNAAAKLNKEAKMLFPKGKKIVAGLYYCVATNGGTNINFRKASSVIGGSHEALWDLLPDFLKAITDLSLINPVDPEASQNLLTSVDEFRQLLDHYGGPIWLTRFRNKINYSHEFGAWHPYTNSSCDMPRLLAVLERWKSDPSDVIEKKTKGELLHFCESCTFLAALCRTTMKDLVFRSRAGSPFSFSSAHWIQLADS